MMLLHFIGRLPSLVRVCFWLIFMLFPWVFCISLRAQSTAGTRVLVHLTAADNSAVASASVALMRAQDSLFVKAAVPDQDGLVEFEQAPPGEYFLWVNLLGFQKHYSPTFVVEANNGVLRLPEIKLVESTNTLSELTVAAKKPFIERKLDRLVVNVDNSIVNVGSTLLEVLERAPSVSVNQDNGLFVRGKSGVIVMLDGRPTPLAGADLISYLRTIPSANIDRIDIITNPSAKYDAAGNAGIIDIRFKKDKREGFNGNLVLTYGQGFYGKPSASTNLNYRNKKWSLYGNYGFSAPKGFTRFYINRKFFDADHELAAVFDQTSFIKQPILAHVGKIGFDYSPTKKTVIGLMINANASDSDRDGDTHSIVTAPNGALQYTNQTNIRLKTQSFNGFVNANLKQELNKKGAEWTVDLDWGRIQADNFQHVVSGYFDAVGAPGPSNVLETEQGGGISVQSAKTDLVCPLGNQVKLETGLKTSFVETDNDIRFFDVVGSDRLLDTLRSNHFIYQENVNAAYVNFSREMKRFDLQVGLRLEHTATDGKQVTTGQNFTRDYINFFPSFLINRKFSPNYQMALSYSRRIDRPSYRQLNPFRLYVDPYTYVVGDPELKPVLTDAFEISHTIRGRYIATLGYSRSQEVITDIFVQDDATKISNQIPANLRQFDYVNLSINVPFSIGKWLNSNLSGETYWGKYDSPLQGGQLINEFVTWNAQLNNSFALGKNGWSAELTGLYRAQEPWGLFIIRDLAQVSTGIQKVSADKNSTFKLSFTDIFYTNRIAVVVRYQNMDFFTNRTWDGRMIACSFTHRFGKNTVAQARRRSSGVEEEKRRANG